MEDKAAQTEEVNCAPLSDVISAGTPNLATHPCSRAWAQAAAVVEAKGMASGQRVERSTMVKRWVKPPDEGRGPTRST